MPDREQVRLAELERYRIMDTAAEVVFDELTQLAAQICDTPIALVSLVDDSRQWFKSKVGLTGTQTPRHVAFCAHAIEQPEVFVVADAASDERFANNPLVLGEPGVRFYAGAPLQMRSGHRLGTLCVIDRKPRQLSTSQLAALRTLRSAIVAQLELRRAIADLQDMQRLLPMCAWCRSVRTEAGDWQALHQYVAQQTQVTHGICPDCEADFVGG